jgi:hypothetical protein
MAPYCDSRIELKAAQRYVYVRCDLARTPPVILVALYTILRRMLVWDSLSVLLSPFSDGVTSELSSHVPLALY